MLFLFFKLVDVYTSTEFTMKNYAYVGELFNWEQLRIMDFLVRDMHIYQCPSVP